MRVLIIAALLFMSSPSLAAVYLDSSGSGCSNAATNYNPVLRSCGSGSDTVYTSLATFNDGIVAGATNYIRAGTYYRTTGSETVGALEVGTTKGGSAGSRTIIKAYPGEERTCYIGTASNRMPVSVGGTAATDYNPIPSDFGSSGTFYYPNPAITIKDDYVTIDGLKTYGQVGIWVWGPDTIIHDITIQNCDLGGGGPDMGIEQGNVVFMEYCYNVLITNNYIHHSTRGDASWNGALIMGYNFHADITHNTFADAYEAAIYYKDTGDQSGRTGTVAYNFFGPSTIFAGGGTGFRSNMQDAQLSNFHIYNNIFYNLETGINWALSVSGDNLIYNNTFVKCGGRAGEDAGGDILQIISDTGHTLSMFNNLYYHTGSAKTYDFYREANLGSSNYNVWYTTTGNITWDTRTTNTTSLATWISSSGEDAASLSHNPNFVNATGTTAASFKRSSYVEDFTASSYGTYAGAYETGSEQIGHDWESTTAPSGSLRSGVSASGVTFR